MSGTDSGILIAPTEPPALKRIGVSSSAPEQYGVDVMWAVTEGLCGVQRKELGDLVSSMQDGRLAKEIAQMQDKLQVAAVMVEGRGQWGVDGALLKGFGPEVNRQQVRNFLYSIRLKGVWVEFTDDLNDTISAVRGLKRWTEKPTHDSLLKRPGPGGTSDWGKVTRREWAVHLLCGFDGIGVGMAQSIIDHFDGVPLQWEVTKEELMEVPGIGKGRAEKLMKALDKL